MKKLITSIIFGFLLLSLTSCSEEEVLQKYYKTEKVETGSIVTTLEYSTTLEGIQETTLAPEQGGKIIQLLKEKGQRVSVGEKIALVDTDELQSNYQSSNQILGTLFELKKSIESSYDSQIEAKKSELLQEKRKQTGLQTQEEDIIDIQKSDIDIYENKKQEAEIALQLLKTELEQTIQIGEQQKEKLYTSASNIITSSLILNTEILSFVDTLLGISEKNKDKNDSFDDYLGVKNTRFLLEAKVVFAEAETSHQVFKDFYIEEIEKTGKKDNEILKEGLTLGYADATKLKELLRLTDDILNNSIENIYFSKETIQGYAQQVYNYGTQIESTLSTSLGGQNFGLQVTPQEIELLESTIEKQIKLLEEKQILAKKQVSTSETILERLKNGNQSQINEVYTNQDIGDINIIKLQSQIDAFIQEKNAKIQEIQTQIFQITGGKNIQSIQIQNATIFAPYTGIITEKFNDVGTFISAGTPMYTLSDDSQIQFHIPLHVDDEKYIDSESFFEVFIHGMEQSFTGNILQIPSFQDKTTKYIDVKGILSNKDFVIPVGSGARVVFSQKSDEGIRIPNSAIISDFLQPSVMILEEGIAHIKPIEIEEKNEVWSLVIGIKAGDILISEGQENIWDGELLY